jgi:pilus assembly protein CpaE
VDQANVLVLAERLRFTRPALGFILVRRRLDTTVLSESLRAGVREVLAERDISSLDAAVKRAVDYADALRTQAGVSVDHGPSVGGSLITVFSAKGGCGKTTLATNLATALVDGGRHSVCLVDLDLAFGDVAIALQLFPAHTIADAVPMQDHLDASGVQALLTRHSAGLMTLAAPMQPDVKESISPQLVGQILDLLRVQYSYVVVDTPPAFDDQVLQALDRTDVLLLLATLDIPALKNLKLTLETLELLNYPRDAWRVVLNRADAKVGLAVGEVERTLRMPIAAQIPSSRDVPASINRGVPLVLEDPRHPVSVSIRAIADLVTGHRATTPGRAPSPTPAAHRKSGPFRRRLR